MLFERRRLLRRALSGGIVLPAMSMLPLALMELIYVLAVHRPVFDSYYEAARFSFYLFLLLASVGAVLGALEGIVGLGVSMLTKVVAKKRVAEPKWMARIYSLLALPGIAVAVAMMFSGRSAQQIPYKHVLATAIGLLAVVLTYFFLRLVIGVRDRFRIRRWGPRQAAWMVPLLLVIGALFYWADQAVLARLYAWFHIGLMLIAVAWCQLAAGALYCAYRPTARWMGRMAEPGVAFLIFIAGVAALAWSLNRVGRSERLRFLYYEHTVVQSKVLALAKHLGVARAAPIELRPEMRSEKIDLPPDPPFAGPRLPDASIVLLSVDALRGDHMGTYGYRRRTTPNLDRWAKQAVVFERAYCQVPHTSFSVTSLMVGNYHYSVSRADPGRRHRTIAEVLRRYGFKTAGFFSPAVFYIDRQQFSAFESSKYGFEYVKFEYLDAERRVDQVITFLGKHPKQKAFVWAHFFEPHEPYERHDGFDFGPRAVDRYDGEIAYVDHHIGRLLEYLSRERPNTIVALTADHGEEFGEHGAHYHGNALFDQQIRVPGIIRIPGVEARRVSGAIQIIDLPVTLIALGDVPLMAGMRGRDLGPWLVGEDPGRLKPVFSEMERKKMMVRGHHKLICDTDHDFCELYDLDRDPMERVNLVAQKPELLASMRQDLYRWMGSHIPRGDDGQEESEIVNLLQRGRQKDAGAIPGLIKLCKGSGETKREAVKLLTLMRARSAKAALIGASRDGDPGVWIQASVGAALLGHAESMDRLPAILKRPDLPPQLRRDALLARAMTGDQKATAALARHLSASDEIYERKELIEALGKLGDPVAAPALRRQLKTLRTRLLAIEALGRIRDRLAVPELIRGLRQDRFISWRRAAAEALGQIGDPSARKALHEAARGDLEADVVAAALVALGRLGGLPVPGLQTLKTGPWKCEGGTCRLVLDHRCTGGVSSDLLLLVEQDGTEEPASSRALDLRCGTHLVSTVGLDGREALVIQLQVGVSGSLTLEVAGRPPKLRYAARRSLSRGK